MENRDYSKAKKLLFIQNNLDIMIPVTSFITLMEVVENLKKDAPELKMSDIGKLISLFRKISKIRFLDNVKISSESFKFVLTGIGLKDALHANIAKNENLVFVSEDTDLIDNIKKFYNISMKFYELKKFIGRAK